MVSSLAEKLTIVKWIEHEEGEESIDEDSPLVDKYCDSKTVEVKDMRCHNVLLCCTVAVSLLIGLMIGWLVSGGNVNLALRVSKDLNTISPSINPTYYIGGNLWEEPCNSANASSLMNERCSCTLPNSLISHRTTCLVQPQVLLEEYYQPLVDYYPTQLTYRPQIDCDHGRYLMIDRFRADGLGMTLGSYNALLSMATYHHLQLIEVPWESTHVESCYDPAQERHLRRAQYRAFEWEVTREQWNNCPLNSAVRRNEQRTHEWNLNTGLIFNASNTVLYAHTGETFNETLPFLQKHVNEGLTIRFDYWNGHVGAINYHSLSQLYYIIRHDAHPCFRLSV